MGADGVDSHGIQVFLDLGKHAAAWNPTLKGIPPFAASGLPKGQHASMFSSVPVEDAWGEYTEVSTHKGAYAGAVMMDPGVWYKPIFSFLSVWVDQ